MHVVIVGLSMQQPESLAQNMTRLANSGRLTRTFVGVSFRQPIVLHLVSVHAQLLIDSGFSVSGRNNVSNKLLEPSGSLQKEKAREESKRGQSNNHPGLVLQQ